MKSAILIAGAAMTLACAVAGAASAGSHITDVDYLKANRCRGLAAGLGVGDTASLDALIKTEGQSRAAYIYDKGQQEKVRGERDAHSADAKERLTAELNGACMALVSGGKETAAAR